MTKIQEIVNFTDRAQVGSTCHRMHVYAKEIRDELSECYAIKAQRDELLAALKRCRDWIAALPGEFINCDECGAENSLDGLDLADGAVKQADAAIARAEGGK